MELILKYFLRYSRRIRRWFALWVSPEIADELDLLGVEVSNVRKIANFDPVTGLNSRSAYEAIKDLPRFKDMWRILLDLDEFKPINDEYGHVVGDRVLGFVGWCINQAVESVREYGYRLGGDEMVILAPSEFEARRIVENIRFLLEHALHPWSVEDEQPFPSPLTEYLHVPEEFLGIPPVRGTFGIGPDLESADRNMYEQKPGGRTGRRRDSGM